MGLSGVYSLKESSASTLFTKKSRTSAKYFKTEAPNGQTIGVGGSILDYVVEMTPRTIPTSSLTTEHPIYSTKTFQSPT